MKKVIKFILIIVFFILLIGRKNFVYGVEEIEIKISSSKTEWTNSDVILMIDISTSKIFDSESKQAVQILLGDESSTNKWVDLGNDTNGLALKKSYSYVVKNNAKISVRAIKWNLDDKSDLEQLAIQTYDVSNIDKTNPVIEKIDTNISNNSITLNISAKDFDSGILKYICVCDSISYNKTSESSKFEITNLESNKEYIFTITVQDKLGNKVTSTKNITTVSQDTDKKNNVQNTTNGVQNTTNSVQNTINNINTNIVENNRISDNTVANKIIPQIGKTKLLFASVLVSIICIFIIKTKDRI